MAEIDTTTGLLGFLVHHVLPLGCGTTQFLIKQKLPIHFIHRKNRKGFFAKKAGARSKKHSEYVERECIFVIFYEIDKDRLTSSLVWASFLNGPLVVLFFPPLGSLLVQEEELEDESFFVLHLLCLLSFFSFFFFSSIFMLLSSSDENEVLDEDELEEKSLFCPFLSLCFRLLFLLFSEEELLLLLSLSLELLLDVEDEVKLEDVSRWPIEFEKSDSELQFVIVSRHLGLTINYSLNIPASPALPAFNTKHRPDQVKIKHKKSVKQAVSIKIYATIGEPPVKISEVGAYAWDNLTAHKYQSEESLSGIKNDDGLNLRSDLDARL
ncbi:hypothetical protein NQ317_003112 [Molorchus minor]|uniref:Uncharacterized protein n=1 Tax=Molorchus minor TaxID=1323400 RepID=A0ABQ9JH14_9CUCU|nr:hypothetical protein NQ317_003112 [Molorchus minor]